VEKMIVIRVMCSSHNEKMLLFSKAPSGQFRDGFQWTARVHSCWWLAQSQCFFHSL